jgi:Tfp pilus assembly protein PilN
MIRINLLASPEDRAAYRNTDWPAWTAAVGGLAMLAVALVAVVWWTWTLRAETAEVSRGLAVAEAALRSLTPAIDRTREVEALGADLLGVVGPLEELHARRNTARRVLDNVSSVLPDDLWLSEVREESGGVFVRGHGATLASVSGYVAALEAAGGFGAPVDLVDSQRGDRIGGRQLVNFEIRLSSPAAGGRP